ncbi:MAG TPA: response regulator transcription factor [Candidatus Dormibacteraeota bacterium]|nr:response regulator transcription factor [Candidatus Dormibacteraeota bacterium]
MRVIVAEDSVLLREGLVRLLTEAGIDVVAQVGDADQLRAQVERTDPNAVVVDVRMPPTQTTEGLRAALDIRAAHPGIGVLVLSQHVETEYAVELLAGGRGGVGYLLKERVADVAALIDAVGRVAAGGSVVDPEVVGRLLTRHRTHDPLAELSDRERDVLRLIAEGRSNAAIGALLFITASTVETHISSIFSKLGLNEDRDGNRRVLAVLAFLRA